MFTVATLLVFNYCIEFNQLWQHALHRVMAKYAKQLNNLLFVTPKGFFMSLAY